MLQKPFPHTSTMEGMVQIPSSGPSLLPPGFRFHPTDEELIIFYLKQKVLSPSNPFLSIIADINIYMFNPWELPVKAKVGETEWFFFSPRDRKYPNGARPNRAAASGYWKATGTDTPILSSCGSMCLGVKKALVFYTGRAPKGMKTSWMMQEYRLLDETCRPHRVKGSMRLDNFVLCRLRQKGKVLQPVTSNSNGSSSSCSPPYNAGFLQGQDQTMGSSPSTQNYGYDHQLEGFFLTPRKCEEETVDMPWVDLLESSPEYPLSAPTSMDDDPLRCLFNCVEEVESNILDDLTRLPPNKRLNLSISTDSTENEPCFSPFHQHIHQTSWDCDLTTFHASPCSAPVL